MKVCCGINFVCPRCIHGSLLLGFGYSKLCPDSPLVMCQQLAGRFQLRSLKSMSFSSAIRRHEQKTLSGGWMEVGWWMDDSRWLTYHDGNQDEWLWMLELVYAKKVIRDPTVAVWERSVAGWQWLAQRLCSSGEHDWRTGVPKGEHETRLLLCFCFSPSLKVVGCYIHFD